MRIFSFLLSLLLLVTGIYYLTDAKPEFKTKMMEFLSSGQFHTLEVRYSPEQIMEKDAKRLLKNDTYTFLEPEMKFHPYLLMEVKYSSTENTTGEGVILWDLVDGEMVINSKSWKKTHGFSDCLAANADKNEFKIINLLAKQGGFLDRENLIKVLNLEEDTLDRYIENCRRKKLVVQSGNGYRLHLEKPMLDVIPTTVIDTPLVTKSYRYAERIGKRFSASQIIQMAESVFGVDFAVRRTLDVFLPVYYLTVQNPDGSLLTTQWNALNGSPLENLTFIE